MKCLCSSLSYNLVKFQKCHKCHTKANKVTQLNAPFSTSHTILPGIFNSHHLSYLHRSFCSPAPSLNDAVEHRLHSPFAFAELLSVHLYVNVSSQIAYLGLLRELIHFTLHEIC